MIIFCPDCDTSDSDLVCGIMSRSTGTVILIHDHSSAGLCIHVFLIIKDELGSSESYNDEAKKTDEEEDNNRGNDHRETFMIH